jgi:hypothetical protein
MAAAESKLRETLTALPMKALVRAARDIHASSEWVSLML